jgi:hypothetical protein
MSAFIEEPYANETKLEVVCEPQEGRYYYVTTYTEETGTNEIGTSEIGTSEIGTNEIGTSEKRYYTTKPLIYMGRYIGGRIEGWGNDMKEWSHFINDEGQEVIIRHSKLTAFYTFEKSMAKRLFKKG